LTAYNNVDAKCRLQKDRSPIKLATDNRETLDRKKTSKLPICTATTTAQQQSIKQQKHNKVSS